VTPQEESRPESPIEQSIKLVPRLWRHSESGRPLFTPSGRSSPHKRPASRERSPPAHFPGFPGPRAHIALHNSASRASFSGHSKGHAGDPAPMVHTMVHNYKCRASLKPFKPCRLSSRTPGCPAEHEAFGAGRKGWLFRNPERQCCAATARC
jgi:hypothetical protein